jgi:murein DD-endopeptidase MepM/ murein hydrolase activator NlpD
MMNNRDITAYLKANAGEFHPVVPFFPGRDKLVALDLSVANPELTETVYLHTEEFGKWVNGKIELAGASYAIGGYMENRNVYNRSKLFDPVQASSAGGDSERAEPRRLHLGTDIWGPSYTPVMAPLNGVVHSFAFNNNFGDYGVTIILSHYLDGASFYTLYGHLSLNSIKNLQEGKLISKGEVFAESGMQFENGHWPPHLHFQIILDLEGMKGDYPGVCKLSETEKYLDNCPDPDLILKMNQFIN